MATTRTTTLSRSSLSRRSLFTAFRQPVASEDELRAHVLRRLTMTAHPGAVQRASNLSPLELARSLLDEAYDAEPEADSLIDPANGNNEDFIAAWLRKLWSPDATLRDRMTWFWHNHMPSSFEKAEVGFVAIQRDLLEKHALGNFREMLQALTIDGAMLYYLDGANSSGDDPNENYAREVMELFALGVGNYTEDDVRVAARGLSGWYVDYETKEIGFDPEQHYDRPLRFFGVRKRWTNTSIIDEICDQPACARHVSGAIYRHLVGTTPSESRLDELADIFRSNDLELRPLLEAIIEHPDFLAGVRSRAKTALEYLIGGVAILGLDSVEPDPWWVYELGHAPYDPPNVAGWPGDERWLTASQVLARTNLMFQAELSDRLISSVEPEVDAVLQHCGLFDVSDSTRQAMQDAADEFPFDNTLELLLGIALASPEFQLT